MLSTFSTAYQHRWSHLHLKWRGK